MSNAIEKTVNYNAPATVPEMQAFLKTYEGEFKKVLPSLINPERFMRTAITVISGSSALQRCTIKSVAKSMIIAAQLGLDFDLIRGEAYLVPFKGECTLIPGYRGLLKLIRNTGKVLSINAVCVYEKEPFEYREGIDRFLKHEPLPPSERGEKIIGAYAVAHLKDGGFSWRWMWGESIRKIKDAALRKVDPEKQKFAPWITSEEEMYLKTVLRLLSKWLDMSPEVQVAVAVSEARENGLKIADENIFDDTINFEQDEDTPQEQTNQLAAAKQKSVAKNVRANAAAEANPEPVKSNHDLLN